MYSHLPNALAELIANSYDADATRVEVIVRNDAGGGSVTVRDNGHGMDFDDLQEKYLRIGRNRRAQGEGRSESGRRVVAGKKGLGKLALFGIGERIELTTKRRGVTDNLHVVMSWNAIKSATGSEYKPDLTRTEADSDRHGTIVELRELRRRSPVNAVELANSLARLFGYLDADFEIVVIDAAAGPVPPINRDTHLNRLELDAEWRIPDDLPNSLRDELPDAGITGRVVAAAKPVGADHRGIALYAHGRLANEPEFFGVSESSYAFSYLTGYLDVDYIDDGAADVISTDRRSVSWDGEPTAALNACLQKLVQWFSRERRTARRDANKARIRTDHGVDVDKWVGSIRSSERVAVEEAASILTSPDSALAEADRSSLLNSLRTIAPDYADLHWRHLHPVIQEVSQTYYESGHFHAALSEALKRFINDVKRAAGATGNKGRDIMNQAFNAKEGRSPRIDIARPYQDAGFDKETLTNFRDGHLKLSEGSVVAFRNPYAHEEEQRLVEADAMSYQDCLDGLSLLSHLYRHFGRALEVAAAGDDTPSGV
nr:TIGR02391 family protein [Kribbella shirazensis]